jgi:hypothetical protein
MTPKEKAKELVAKMEQPMNGVSIFRLASKQLTLIAVNEVIEALHEHHWQNRLIIDYWEEIKHELEKI